MSSPPADLRLCGVDHTAFPTAKPKETIEFYRDVLGLKVMHAITAKGWGWKGGYPDFFHFFFDSGCGSTIAFFYHLNSPPPQPPADPLGYQAQARHTAWLVKTEEEMHAWYEHLKGKGVKVTPTVQHELIESVYFLDPNGYPLEITRRLRDLTRRDHEDAEFSLEAISRTFGSNPSGGMIPDRSIDDMWRCKGSIVLEKYGDAHELRAPAILLLNVPEYEPVLVYAGKSGLTMSAVGEGYLRISAPGELRLQRSEVGLSEALWFSMLVGGLVGNIITYTSDELVIGR